MALVARKSIAAQLLQKSIERQTAIAHAKLKLKPKQVESAIVAHVEHNNVVQYNELIKILREYPLNDDNFKCVVDDCLSCVVLLGRNLIPFVNVVLSLDWVHRDDTLVELYATFLIGLVTAHTYHCPSVMKCLVKLFQGNFIFVSSIFIYYFNFIIGLNFFAQILCNLQCKQNNCTTMQYCTIFINHIS